MQNEGLEIIDGVVERIIYSGEADGYAVIELKREEGGESIVAVGPLQGVVPGEGLRLWGKWRRQQKYGYRFEVENYVTRIPASARAIEQYLASGLIKGIGPVYAARIVNKFGDKTIDIIDKEPERLLEVEGIGAKRLEMIVNAWAKQLRIRELMIFLQQHNIPAHLGKKIYRYYGDNSIEVLKTNPFQLVLDVYGIGFKTADQIAARLGLPLDSPKRIEAGVLHVLNEARDDGHTYLPSDILKAQAVKLLNVAEQSIADAIRSLADKKKIVLTKLIESEEQTAVFLSWLYTCERQVAEAIAILARTGKFIPRIEPEAEIVAYETEHKMTFAEEQKLALRRALKGGVLVITGGPGTGKTTILRALLRILEKYGLRVLLAAPTGRAANRLTEITGKPAATIHRLLKYEPATDTCQYNGSNPLPADFVIVDETSMLDIWLAHKLLIAVSPMTSVVFIGDVDQLPPVGPGNFLKDLILSGTVPVVRFTRIFRQAQRSLIITNSHRINNGEFPYITAPSYADRKLGDFFFIERKEPEEALRTIKLLVKERIPQRFGFHPLEDIQVITPMYRGVLGVNNLNLELQELLNPTTDIYLGGMHRFRIGDKVIQLKNNYDKEVFNGDIGFVETIDREFQVLKVRIGGRLVEYEAEELDQLTLAYAISVHKSQGSEYKAVIIPIHHQHYIMLQRNLLYTAITRARKLVCLVGTKQAIAIAVRNDKQRQRYSALACWLAQNRRPEI